MKNNWSFKKHAICSILIIVIIFIIEILISTIDINKRVIIAAKFLSLFNGSEAGSVGIIGGADGPTAYFFTGIPFILKIGPKLLIMIFLLSLYKPMKWLVNK